MTHCQIDHLTVTAPSLAAGVEFVVHTLGVTPQAGGEHPLMGTHNNLLKLGESVFLEIIAPNPDAQKPQRSRWFGLDDQKPGMPPRLAAWVVRTTDIRVTLAASTEPLGDVERLTRGQLSWLMSVSADGSLPLDGIAPVVIEWHTDTHIATRLQDAGCSFVGLEAFHPEADRISALLKSISLEGPISVRPLPAGERPRLVASIQTPGGLRKLSAP